MKDKNLNKKKDTKSSNFFTFDPKEKLNEESVEE